MNRLAPGQRIVVVVGIGAALLFAGDFLTSFGSFTGWTGYAPLSRAPFGVPGPLQPWQQLLIWLVLVAVWVGVSLFILRPRDRRPDT